MTANTQKKAAKSRKKVIAENGPAAEVLAGPRVTSKRDVLNIGVIGYGYWGPNLVRNFAELSDARVHTVADLNPKALEVVKKRYPATDVTTDVQAMIRNPDIDAVAIATPVSTHFSLAMAALKAGKHVWLEKPMTETSMQARALIEEANKRGLTLHVDHTFIYTGPVKKMRDLVQSGELGKTLYYDFDPREPWPVPARRERDRRPRRPRFLDPGLRVRPAPDRGVGLGHQPLPRHAGKPGLHHPVL
ncbi:MAG: Gfo/Idh/MocA family oxidoreductase [Hyphomonadaceae bacterium]